MYCKEIQLDDTSMSINQKQMETLFRLSFEKIASDFFFSFVDLREGLACPFDRIPYNPGKGHVTRLLAITMEQEGTKERLLANFKDLCVRSIQELELVVIKCIEELPLNVAHTPPRLSCYRNLFYGSMRQLFFLDSNDGVKFDEKRGQYTWRINIYVPCSQGSIQLPRLK